MAKLPKKVREQGEAADAALKALNEPPPPNDERTPEPTAPERDTEVATPDPQAPAREEEPEFTPNKQDPRYNALLGRYNQQVPHLQGQVRELTQRLQQRDSLIADLNERVRSLETQHAPQPEPEEEIDDVAASIAEEYGDEFAEQMRRLARYEAQQTVKPVGQRLEQNHAEHFHQQLTQLVPDWQAVNLDEGFKSWLGEYEPLAGNTRHALLIDAYNAMDAQRTAFFFNAYKQQLPPNPAQQAAAELERQVVPDTTSGPPPSAPPPERLPTPEEIRQFYADKARGRYDKRPEAAEEMERKIRRVYAGAAAAS